MKETEWERTKVKRRNLRWLESSWEGKSTTAQKEQVLAEFRELVRESRSEEKVREYVPWQPLW